MPPLLEFRLFVHNVLPHDGIVLLEFDLARRVRFVFYRRVEMPCTRRRFEFDLLALTLLGHDRLTPHRFRHSVTTLRKNANALAVYFADADATRFVARRVDVHHVRRVDVTLLFDDTASSRISAPRLEVSLLKSNLFHPDFSIGSDGDDAALLAAVRSCNDLNEVAFSNTLSHVD
jgi:hypothetical protein